MPLFFAIMLWQYVNAAVAQLDRVPDSDSGGRGFESRQPYQKAGIPIRGCLSFFVKDREPTTYRCEAHSIRRRLFCALRKTGRGFESRQPYQKAGIPIRGYLPFLLRIVNPRPTAAKHIQSAGGCFALCVKQVVGSNPVSRTKTQPPRMGWLRF